MPNPGMGIRPQTDAGQLTNINVRNLFRAVADVPTEERNRILADRRIPADLRAELESLLRYDSQPGESLTRRVAGLAGEVLEWGTKPASRYCGPYRLGRLLGFGGMGTVYLAERQDGEIEQKVAVKLLRADANRPAWRDRFLRERQLLAYLNHPSIARLLGAGHTDDGQPYLAMEYVDGVPIDDYAAGLDLHTQLKLFLLVCEGVSHAHQHLIVHRDLKPSNILVDSSGQPKLLDFGIAKLLDGATDETRTVERLLTPTYASPEQLRGGLQTTATDIYSLGAVLHKLLTGEPPREVSLEDRRADPNIPAALPLDLEHILRKALRYEPEERYASVDAFADDIRAFLELRPVQARSGERWYRVRKFLRRRRAAVAGTAIAAASLVLGLSVANYQRGLAQARFVQVRQLANKVLALDEVAGGLHGSNPAMREIVAMSKEQLEVLAREAHKDRDLALELGDAYSLLARTQGISIAATIDQRARAEASLRKAHLLVRPILSASPDNRKALLTSARISHDWMLLATNDRRNEDALEHARHAVRRLNRLLQLGNFSPAESERVSELFYDIALFHKNLHLPEDGIRYARRSIEAGRSSVNAPWRLSLGLSMLADLLRLSGDLHGALAAIREARTNLEKALFPNETERRSAWCRVLGREAKILGVPGGINLNRADEAIPVLQEVVDLLEGWTQADREDGWSRLLFASAGRELGDLLRPRDPESALAVYDHSLRRLREVRDNAESLRGQVEVLAGSAYALRSLNRVNEAAGRIEAAFRLLAETKEYPAESVVLHEGADAALRALGDHLADTGQTQRATEVYENLLGKVMAAQPDPQNDLRHAVGFSNIYGALAALYQRDGQRDRGAAFSARRLELWRHWDRKLPANDYVRRQIAFARSGKIREVSPPLSLRTGRKDETHESTDSDSQFTAPARGLRHLYSASMRRGNGANSFFRSGESASRAVQHRAAGGKSGVPQRQRSGDAELRLSALRLDVSRAASHAVLHVPVD